MCMYVCVFFRLAVAHWLYSGGATAPVACLQNYIPVHEEIQAEHLELKNKYVMYTSIFLVVFSMLCLVG